MSHQYTMLQRIRLLGGVLRKKQRLKLEGRSFRQYSHHTTAYLLDEIHATGAINTKTPFSCPSKLLQKRTVSTVPPLSKNDDNDDKRRPYLSREEQILHILQQQEQHGSQKQKKQHLKRIEELLAEYDQDPKGIRTSMNSSIQLDDMLSAITTKTENERISTTTFHKILKACVDQRTSKAAKIAERILLQYMIPFHQQGDRLRVENDDNNNNTKIKSKEAEDDEEESSISPVVTHTFFGMAIQAWVNTKSEMAGQRAEHILNEMEKLHEKSIDVVKYNAVLKAYAQQGDVTNAQKIFARCLHDFENNGNESARPNLTLWNTLLQVYTKCDTTTNNKDNGASAGEMAEKQLRNLIHYHKRKIVKDNPNTACYNTVITAYTRSNQPGKAQNILEEMCDQVVAGSQQPGTGVVAGAAAAAIPDMYSFKKVLLAWFYAGKPKQCEKLLNYMLEVSTKNKNLFFPSPDNECYNTVIVAYGKPQPNHRPRPSPEDCERIFQKQLQDHYEQGNAIAVPNSQTFCALASAWGQSKRADAGIQAEEVLQRVIDWNEQGILKTAEPTTELYNAVMNAWANLGKAKEAESVLARMQQQQQVGSWKRIQPDRFSYATLLKSYALEGTVDAGDKADYAMEEMKRDKVIPDRAVYGNWSKCWSISASKNHPRAKERLKQVHSYFGGWEKKKKKMT